MILVIYYNDGRRIQYVEVKHVHILSESNKIRFKEGLVNHELSLDDVEELFVI